MSDVKVPAVGESITEVTIASWLKKDGDVVKMDEAVCSIESDKATLEISAPSAGVLKIIVEEGTTVKIGDKIAEISEGGAKAETKKEEPKVEKKEEKSSESSKNFPSPAAGKILAEKGVDPSSVEGSGKDGRITKGDALNASNSQESKPASVPKTVESDVKSLAQQTMGNSFSRDTRREKMSGLRKTIASRLVAAKNTTAMLTTFNEVDMSAVMEVRKKYKDQFKEKHGVGLGFMSFFTKAVCAAIRAYPAVNAQIAEGNEIIYHNYADVGVAVSTPRGLVVPVLRNAEAMSLAQIEAKILEMALKARDNKITIEDMQGGTFTITNGGVFGSMMSTPILNAPQSAILGMHNIVERAVVVNGQIVIRPIMYIALSYDHRIVDGRESVSFLKTIKEMIEDPSRLLLDV